MNAGKVISQILTVAIWSAGSIGLPFNILCFLIPWELEFLKPS